MVHNGDNELLTPDALAAITRPGAATPTPAMADNRPRRRYRPASCWEQRADRIRREMATIERATDAGTDDLAAYGGAVAPRFRSGMTDTRVARMAELQRALNLAEDRARGARRREALTGEPEQNIRSTPERSRSPEES